MTQYAPIADRLQALDNVVISEPSATSALLGPYKAAAEAIGAHIRFTYMAQGAMPAALENNAIQGMVASFPFVGTPIIRGTGVLWIDGPGGELPAEVLPASSSCAQTTAVYAKENPDVIRRLRQTVADIAAFIETDPHAAQRALAAGYPQLSPQDIDLAFRQQWRNWTKPDLTTDDMRQAGAQTPERFRQASRPGQARPGLRSAAGIVVAIARDAGSVSVLAGC